MKIAFLSILTAIALPLSAQHSDGNTEILKALQSEKDKSVLAKKIQKLEKGSAEDLNVLIQYYNKDSAKKDAATKMLLKKYPESQPARFARVTSFLHIKGGPEEMEVVLNRMINAYPNINLDMEKTLVALAYAEVPDTAKAMQYINSMKDPVMTVRSVLSMLEIISAFNNSIALDIATKQLPAVMRIKNQTTPSGPLKIDPKNTYFDYINMYGKLLFKAGENDAAYKYTVEAYNNIKDRDDELIQNYAFLSSLRGNYDEALPILANAVKEGKNDKRYLDQVRAGYAKLNPGRDVDAYIASLQQEFAQKIKSHVEKLMINEAAPDFYVTDANGKKVTLSDFKGKTILLDFWATWCGPCVASFPAMQMAAKRFAHDENVKFLFVHTWENVADPLKDAKSFLSKHKYNFDLYMDPRDPETRHSAAADAFKIDGIPAKFIIDAKGRIRFKVAGFSGTDENAAEEVVQMIEMARK